MRKKLSLALSIMMIVSSTLTAFGADTSLVPFLPGEINGKAIALDLYDISDAETQDKSSSSKASAATIVTPKTDYQIEALVQSYVKSDGEFELNENSRFYIDSVNPPSNKLYSTVRLIDAAFASKGLPSETALPVVYGSSKYAKPGDIVITNGVDKSHFQDYAVPEESYLLSVSDKVEIMACDTDGIYYGLITLLEMALSNGIKDDTIKIPGCEINDGPDLKERTLFIDCARKYFSPEWIKNLIRRASMQRYNAIEIHFSEAEGTRFESAAFPWLTKNNKALTRVEMTEIIELAKTYHMDVIPSMDIPGHTEYIVKEYKKYVKAHPDWSFTCDDVVYDKSIKGFGSIANHYSYNGETKKEDYIGIDVTKKHAVAFINALVDDYAEYFRSQGCDRINICGDELLGWYSFTLGGKQFGYENRWESLEHWDEYAKKTLGIKNGSASDTFVNYLNTVASRLEEKGYRVRVFNDEINLNKNQHVKLNSSIELNYWTGLPASPKTYVKEGHYMYNDVSHWNFYVVKNKGGGDIMTTDFSSVNPENIYKNWNPRSFSSKKDKVKTIPDAQFGGSYFHIWCDHPDFKSDQTIWDETNKLTWTNSCKMWNPEITDSLKYKRFGRFVSAMGSFPGYTGNPNEAATLAEPAKLSSGTNWWQKMLTLIGIY